VVDQVCGGLCHAPCSAPGANAAALGVKGDTLFVTAVTASQPQEAVREDAAFEEAIELALDELRQSASTAASTSTKKVPACCCTKRHRVVCTGR
jgi:enamine deaminase RidA (YjgF/YER057c/UK114 family)